jgi:hypothetical protein
MDECTAFEEVFSGDSPAALLSAIKDAMDAGKDEAYVESIQRHARNNSWLERAKTMIGAIEGLRTS